MLHPAPGQIVGASTDYIQRMPLQIQHEKVEVYRGWLNHMGCKEADQAIDRLLEFPRLWQTYSLADLIVFTDTANDCVKQWNSLVL